MSIQAQHIAVIKFDGGASIPLNSTSNWHSLFTQAFLNPTAAYPWVTAMLYSPAMLAVANNYAYLVMVLTNDVAASQNQMEVVAKLISNPALVLESSGVPLKFSPVSTPEAAGIFTGGDVQLFRQLMQNLREQHGLA